MRKIIQLLINGIGLILLLILFSVLPWQSLITLAGQRGEIAHPVTSLSAPLITLPTLNYSTYLGGSEWDNGIGIAVASDNSCYVVGNTWSSDFPARNANNNTYGGYGDAFVSKFAANGSLLWSTFLGGSNFDAGQGIAVTADDSCYVTGVTYSSDFPVKNAYNSTYSGDGDIYITKFSADGTMLWSTFFGGNGEDLGFGITSLNDGNCYVTGFTNSSNFPIKDAFQSTYSGENDAFVVKFSSEGNLLWSTFLGGSERDCGETLALASDGSCYVTGTTESSDFVIKNAYDDAYNGGWGDSFITKFSSNGSLLWSTYLGGNDYEEGYGIAVASDGSCYVTGTTNSSDFPILNAYDDTFNGGEYDIYITKFTADGTLLWSTYLGGSEEDCGEKVAIAEDGSCYVTAWTSSNNFPLLYAYDSTYHGMRDAVVAKFASNGSLLWSTFLGGSEWEEAWGIAIASDGSCYVTGLTGSSDFPTINAYDGTYNGGPSDAFVMKIIEVEDFIGPSISNIYHSPENPTTKDNVTISCTATDISGIQSVTLYYRVNNGTWETITMAEAAPDTYQAILDITLEVDDMVEYYLEAVDNSQNYNVAVNNNYGFYYNFTVQSPPTQPSVATGVLAFVVCMPILAFVVRKRRK